MNKIDYQSLRKAAQNYQSTLAWYQAIPDSPTAERDCNAALDAFKHHIRHREVDIISELLDELDEKQQYIKFRDQENEDIALTVGKLRVELEETKSKLSVQREYYEDVISDGGKRIAELEKIEEQLINERDHAESALADMYFAATGDRPEWSNWFGFSDAVDAVVDRIADLEAKQSSPVVPEGLVKAVRFYEQVKREKPPVETGAWKDAVDWVLKEACQAVHWCRQISALQEQENHS